ncbi:hypothetical protein [Croceicoccus sp. YJ47]|uniref:hypothetical protein n=1 Tax=Croceicoccus sp. YJ47 TaxID=2798724 RepID=UPI0019216B1A|nr:hypothetical protein [Croceicoccus sp. YJ47]QQN73728.1 hypothetical protein JD971_13225 [Croceicoccus sp. YJ47]
MKSMIDSIWHIRGSVPLRPGQDAEEAFTRLDPLFATRGTTHRRDGDTLTFHKKDQEAQDKLSIFDGGTLRVEAGPGGRALRYNMKSRALLYCFLAPLLFLAIAQVTVLIGQYEANAAKAEESDKKEKAEDEDLPQHFIDAALGAPVPEKPSADDAEEDKGPKPTAAYIFAGIFAALYVVGRILESWLVKSLFRRRLSGDTGDIRASGDTPGTRLPV